mgnify:CR=1 FL=1
MYFQKCILHGEHHHYFYIYYKEHPLNKNYKGIELPRDWMFTVQGYFPSFFSLNLQFQNQILPHVFS